MTKETNQNDNPVEEKVKNKKRENRGREQNNRKPKRRVNESTEKSTNTSKLPRAKSTRRIGGKRKPEVKVNSEYDFEFKKGKLKIIPLGGLEEIMQYTYPPTLGYFSANGSTPYQILATGFIYLAP